MHIRSLLRSGYTFTPDEYELETKYVVTNALLFFMSFAYILPIVFYYLSANLEKSFPYIFAFIINLFSLYVARIVGKNNYQMLVYFSMTLYSFAIFYANYIEPGYTPSSAWVLILIITSFLVTTLYTGVVIALGYFGYLFYMNIYGFEYYTYEYIVLQITPVLVGLLVVYMFEKKFVNTIILLENTNKKLELKVKERTQELEEEKIQLDYQAHYDFLTDLPNRNKFNKELEEWINNDKDKTLNFYLFFIDLDRFKRVNDSLGHSAGDEVLRIVTSRIKKMLDKDMFFSRISGDEFTLLLPHNGNIDRVHHMAKDIIATIEEPIVLDEHKLYISASIGISNYPENTLYYDDLVKYADLTMFEAKKSGRGTYKFYAEELSYKVDEIVLMETEIHTALENDEFVLYYQRQVDMRTNTVSGIEALIRWNHTTGTRFLPESFIPLAEETGVIIALDYYILKKGMCQIVQWKKDGLDIPRVSFNFSTKHLQQKGFTILIEDFLLTTGCRGEWIELEITESHILSNIEEAIVILESLKKLGITIAIDDFGTGYSSLTYLKRLPVDKLKIDKSFIEKIEDNAVDKTITKAIIDIGNTLGLTVIAEGVETQAQKDYLYSKGCYHIQGYIYEKPLSAEKLREKYL